MSVKNKKVAGKNIEWLVDFEIHQPQWPVDNFLNFHPCVKRTVVGSNPAAVIKHVVIADYLFGEARYATVAV